MEAKEFLYWPKIPLPTITANDIMCDQTIHAAICNAVQPSLPEKNHFTNELSYTLCWLEQVLYENFTPYASGCKVLQSEFSMCQLSFSTGHVATPGWAEVVLVQPCGTVTGVGGHHWPHWLMYSPQPQEESTKAREERAPNGLNFGHKAASIQIHSFKPQNPLLNQAVIKHRLTHKPATTYWSF